MPLTWGRYGGHSLCGGRANCPCSLQSLFAKIEAVAAPFFENAWIDVPARPGKAPGAFAHPCVPSAHPYLLLNYQGKTRDVMTLAHELGHGVHQRFGRRSRPV